MAKYRVTIQGATKYQREVSATNADGAARKVAHGNIEALGDGFYTDSSGHTIRVEMITDGEDDPLRTHRDEE